MAKKFPDFYGVSRAMRKKGKDRIRQGKIRGEAKQPQHTMKKALSLGFLLFVFLHLAGSALAQDASSENGGQSASRSSDANPGIDVKSLLDQQLDPLDSGLKMPSLPEGPGSALKTMETYQPSSGAAAAKNLSSVDPDRYRLQPGDGVVVEMWTPSHLRVAGTVSPLGTLNINPVGEVPVRGIAVRNLSAHLSSLLKKYYKNVQVSAGLTDVRSVKVQVLGEVMHPGSYEVSGTAGALDAVGKAGDLTDKASLRSIELLKDNRKAATLDYFKWRVFGDQDQNPYVEPNETVYVPVGKNKVFISGEVRRPGTYEFRSGETFGDLVEMAGGYTPEAVVGEVKLSRIKTSISKINVRISNGLALQDGDSVYVPPSSLFEKKIRVIGELNGLKQAELKRGAPPVSASGLPEPAQTGWYRVHDNDRVRDVVLNMGGLTPSADASRARVERRDKNGVLTIYPVDLRKLFAGNDAAQNMLLQDGDTLVVPPVVSSVFVIGEVGRAGVVPYSPGAQIREYLALAGGPTQHSNLKHARLVRQENGSPQPKVYDVNLQDQLLGKVAQSSVPIEPGDVIYVPRREISGLGDLFGFLGNYAILKALFNI